jgi:hypothetical protein
MRVQGWGGGQVRQLPTGSWCERVVKAPGQRTQRQHHSMACPPDGLRCDHPRYSGAVQWAADLHDDQLREDLAWEDGGNLEQPGKRHELGCLCSS